MSTTTTVFAKPLYSSPIDHSVDNLDLRGNQKPEQNTDGSDIANQNTQEVNTTATSDGEDQLFKERYVNLKRHHDSKIFEARNRIKELEGQVSSTGKLTPPKTAEEMNMFKEENPDMFAAMQSMMMGQSSQIDPSRVAKLEEELFESRQRNAIEQIRQVHSDYVNVIASPAFEAWLENQSSMVKSMVEENSTDSAAFIRAIDLYKLDTSTTTADKGTSFQKSNVADSAADAVIINGMSIAETGTPPGRIWTREEIGKLHPKDFALYEEDIDTAWAEGRVR